MSDVSLLPGISGLSFDSTLLSPLLFFCLVLLLFLSYLFFSFFFCHLVHFPELFLELFSIFFVKRQAFLYGSSLAARRNKLVGGMCSMLPYGTGICCHAFIYYFLICYCSCSFLFYIYFKKNLVLINRRNGLRYQRVLAVCVFFFFFKRGNTEGTNSSKILRLMFVYFLFQMGLCQD